MIRFCLILVWFLPAWVGATPTSPGSMGSRDLGAWDFQRDGPVALRDNWLLAPGELLEPWQWVNNKSVRQRISLPVYLNTMTFADGTTVAAQGVVTLKTTVINIPDDGEALGVTLPRVYTSARWVFVVNGRRTVFEAGKVALSADESIPTMRRGLVKIPRGSVLEIYLQIANFDSSWIGPVDEVVLGNFSERERAHEFDKILGIAVCTFLLLIAVSSLVQFCIRPRDRTSLWFLGFACSVLVVEGARVGLYFVHSPDAAVFQWALRTPYLGALLAGIFLLGLTESLVLPLQARLRQGIFCLLGGLFVVSLLVPVHELDGVVLNFFLALGLAVVASVVSIVWTAFRLGFTRVSGTIGLGILTMTTAVAHDVLIAGGWLEPPYLMSYSIVILVACQSMALAFRAEQERKKSEYLSERLRHAVQERTQALDQRTREAEMARHALEKLDFDKTKFFQNVSHELRTPLTLILAPIEALKEAGFDGSSLDLIERNARRLLKLVNQLLDFQKISTQADHVVCRPLDLIPFLRSVSAHFEAASLHRGLSFSCIVMRRSLEKTSDGLVVMSEPDSLEKIVFNLLSNAFKYTEPGGSISLLVDLDGDDVFVRVQDTWLRNISRRSGAGV